MSKFLWVSGQLAEVQRFVNVPMRWCELYPARERRQLWGTTADGRDATTGRQVNYIRSDPPLLWWRCDAAAIALLSAISITALAMSAWATPLVGVPLGLLYALLVVTARLLWRYRTRGQGDRAMAIAKCRACGRPLLRRVKYSSANLCDRPANATPSPPGCNRRTRSIVTIFKATKHRQ